MGGWVQQSWHQRSLSAKRSVVSRELGGGWVGGWVQQSWHQRSLSAKRSVVSRELGGGWVGGWVGSTVMALKVIECKNVV